MTERSKNCGIEKLVSDKLREYYSYIKIEFCLEGTTKCDRHVKKKQTLIDLRATVADSTVE